jgi:hypothetical protein
MTAEAKLRYRLKLASSMLTTYGYALLGGSVLQPALTTGRITLPIYVSVIAGVVSHTLAIYICPRGEKE